MRNPPWWHSPGITLAGRCRLRNGNVVTVVPHLWPNQLSTYRAVQQPIFFDLEGNALALGTDWDIVENLENLHRSGK